MTKPCPVCGKPVPGTPEAAITAPFCSKRCADIDLGRWLSAQYVVPGSDGEADQDDRGEPD